MGEGLYYKKSDEKNTQGEDCYYCERDNSG